LTTARTPSPSHQKPPRLVVFDVEGVMIPKRRYLLFEASRRVSFVSFMKMVWFGLLYELGLISIETALKKIFQLLRGLPFNDLFQLYKKTPIMQGVKETFDQLKKAGCKTALISSGLPQVFLEDLASQLGCDYTVGLDLDVVEGLLTGEIRGEVIKRGGKAIVLKRILEKEDLTPLDCAVVVDDRNNLPIFGLCHTRIGYNPDFLVTYKSDAVVKGDLTQVLPPLIGTSTTTEHSVSSKDIIRENIHIAGFFVPVFTMYFALNYYWVAFLILIVTLFYIMSELARMQGVNIPIVSSITWNAAIQPEIYEFATAPIFFALGIMLALLLFPPPISYASIAIFTLGDGSATIFGKTIGRHVFPYNKGKSVEGTVLAFFLAWLGALVFVSPLKAFVGAAVGMTVESLPAPINDNVTIPMIAGLALVLLP